MPDWKITLTRAVIVKGQQKAIQIDYVVEDMDRNLAIIEGVDKLLHKASQGETAIVPQEALKWWGEVRASGNLQLYEILSGLETQWGLSFGSQEANAVEPSPQPQPRNGHVEEVSDLDSMLKNQLKVLQARNAVLNANIDKMTAERDKNDANIMRIAQFLGGSAGDFIMLDKPFHEAVKVPPKKRGRISKADRALRELEGKRDA
jgi:hypothetical protein